MRKPAATTGEERLIAKFFAPLAKHPGALELRDDTAVLTPPAGCDLVLTKDAIVAGVHFFPNDPADAIARKALRVNLSDLAAKGAAPAGFLLALALPGKHSEGWLKSFARGLGEDADTYSCPLLGGDTVRTPGPLTVSITAFGFVPHGKMVQRRGAKVGDRVIVTGTIGDAALALALRKDPKARRWKLNAKMQKHLAWRYLLPQPRNVLATLLQQKASAAMDISDGLAGDLAKLCRVSRVSAEIDVRSVPLSDAARAAAVAADPALVKLILSGGDDYEILCTVPVAEGESFIAGAQALGVKATDIGQITAGEGAPHFLRGGRTVNLGKAAYSHF
jgi:thiamine-monophosphate kinase